MEEHNNISDRYNELIINYLTGLITPEDMEILAGWIKSSEENRETFEVHRRAWLVAGLLKGDRKKEAEKAYDRLILMRNEKVPEKQRSKKINLSLYLRIAATWLLFMMAGSGITMILSRKEPNNYRNAVKISVPLGAKSNIVLPDGSKAWLNAGTELTYSADYGHEKRTLHLTGEAFFDVARDEEHPFIVETSDVIIRALGTQFNVKAYPDEKTITTTLVEGKVDVRLIHTARQLRKITLLPDEEIVYYKPGYTRKSETSTVTQENFVPQAIMKKKTSEVEIISNVDAKLSTSWKDDRWIIHRQPLGYLVPLLERRYNLKIIFGDDELKRYNFTGIIQNETAEQIMHALSFTAPLSYTISNDTIRLSLNRRDKDHFNNIMGPIN